MLSRQYYLYPAHELSKPIWDSKLPRKNLVHWQNDQTASSTPENGTPLTCITTAGAEFGGIHAAQSLHVDTGVIVDVGDAEDLLLGKLRLGEDAAWMSKGIVMQATNMLAREPRTPNRRTPGLISCSWFGCLDTNGRSSSSFGYIRR